MTFNGSQLIFMFSISKESQYDNNLMQVLLVTGGQDGQILDSTEILEMKENSVWKMSAPLPSPRLGLRAATVGNSLHVFGKTFEYLLLWLR